MSYSDSTELNMLLSARRQAKDTGVVMVLACMLQLLLQRFALTGADTVLRTHTTVAEAEAYFAG
ncbi:STAS domain-containing protein [Streptomyces sp. NPDC088760]|uniref:STAS domain-containing protein n=1 Tax=Streptomyces sp. NPDC088760 TaxID=3365890 RepID=UPI00382FCD03